MCEAGWLAAVRCWLLFVGGWLDAVRGLLAGSCVCLARWLMCVADCCV
jgi:hypothetical protein